MWELHEPREVLAAWQQREEVALTPGQRDALVRLMTRLWHEQDFLTTCRLGLRVEGAADKLALMPGLPRLIVDVLLGVADQIREDATVQAAGLDHAETS